MKTRRNNSFVSKIVAATLCVAIGFGLAKAAPEFRFGDTAAKLGWNVVASESQESFLTGDGRRFEANFSEHDAEYVEIAIASSETFAPVAEFAAVATNLDAQKENFAESFQWADCKNSDSEDEASWRADTKLPENLSIAEFTDAPVSPWSDWNFAEPIADPSMASELSLELKARSVVEPGLARLIANVDLGTGDFFFQETRTRVFDGGAQNQNVRQNAVITEVSHSAKPKKSRGFVDGTRGAGRYVAPGTFPGATTK